MVMPAYVPHDSQPHRARCREMYVSSIKMYQTYEIKSENPAIRAAFTLKYKTGYFATSPAQQCY